MLGRGTNDIIIITFVKVRFRPGRGCTENVLVIRQLGEKMIERGKLYAAFLDLEKAYMTECGEQVCGRH